MRHPAGLSLPEMLLTLALCALLAGIGIPAFRSLLLDARLTGAVNAWVHTVQLARQAAHLRPGDIAICRSIDAAQCAPPGDWTSGWIVFANVDADDPPALDPGEPILLVTAPQRLVAMSSNRGSWVLRPFGLRATNGTLVFCDERGADHARAVIVSYTGRPRVSRRTASGLPITCPP
jgi:type IV fimbrial biogenesis protein FimT